MSNIALRIEGSPHIATAYNTMGHNMLCHNITRHKSHRSIGPNRMSCFAAHVISAYVSQALIPSNIMLSILWAAFYWAGNLIRHNNMVGYDILCFNICGFIIFMGSYLLGIYGWLILITLISLGTSMSACQNKICSKLIGASASSKTQMSNSLRFDVKLKLIWLVILSLIQFYSLHFHFAEKFTFKLNLAWLGLLILLKMKLKGSVRHERMFG